MYVGARGRYVCDKIVKFRIDARVNSDHSALEEGTVIENDAEEDSVIKEEEKIIV